MVERRTIEGHNHFMRVNELIEDINSELSYIAHNLVMFNYEPTLNKSEREDLEKSLINTRQKLMSFREKILFKKQIKRRSPVPL